MIRLAIAAMLFLAGSALANAKLQADNQAQSVQLEGKLEIPGAVLDPGAYTFAVEDTMQDRTIVRIKSKDAEKHYLVLTVRSDTLPSATGSDGLLFFKNSKGDDKQVLRGWHCPGCSTTLEFVYPTLEAVSISAESGQGALGADPESDKLPVKLSGDDLQVVRLWLLSPKRVMQDAAAQNMAPSPVTTSLARTQTTNAAPAPKPRTQREEDANSAPRLPNTASNKSGLAFLGILALLTSVGLGFLRLRKARS